MRHLFGAIAAVSICALLTPADAGAHGLRDSYLVEGETGIPPIPYRVPEGVAFDPLAGDFYATAIFGGRITRIDGRTGVEETFYTSPNPILSFAGAAVAPLRRVLWMCSVDVATDPAFPTSAVYAVRIRPEGGTLIRAFDLPAPFFCNDVALDWTGAAYVTDSIGASVYRIDASALHDHALEAEPFVTNPALLPDFSIPGALGQNGIAVTPDGRRLMVARSIPPALFSIALDDPSDFREVTFTGDAFGQNPDPAGDPIAFLAPDGLEFLRGRLYVSYHAGVQRLTFRGCDYDSARVATSTAVPSGVSTLTAARGRLYAIDSEVVPVLQTQLGLPVELPNTITRVPLRSFR